MKPVNLSLVALLTSIWLILLALCALIGTFIVPVEGTQLPQFIVFVIGSGKVAISLLFILIWLIGWYKAMEYLLLIKLYVQVPNSTSE